MKGNVLFLFAGVCLTACLPAACQKYKTAADTVKLNKEWVAVSNDIAGLTAELSIAQNNLPEYKTKADKASSDAQSSAQKSSDQAYKATNGDLGEAKSAKKDAKRALNDAEDASSAKNNTERQKKKIDKLTGELEKKQKRLQELEETRTAIRLKQQR
jgi:chromosome segregation ATPase